MGIITVKQRERDRDTQRERERERERERREGGGQTDRQTDTERERWGVDRDRAGTFKRECTDCLLANTTKTALSLTHVSIVRMYSATQH